ncbi:acyltransferase [Vibrio harveyi]|uniref:acyltransferase n=1 Tax=Vibrio harveyi TaxID=669 RepID=UPI003390BEB0
MRQHLQSIENYRGFAIICIVAVHCFHYGMSTTSGPWLAFQSFFYGSTSLFVFISGYMFHHVFYQRGTKTTDFYFNKFKAVVLPYLFLGSLATMLLFATKTGYFEPGVEIDSRMLFSSDDSVFATAVKYILTGRMLTAYWYIPFAVLLFASAPLHTKFLRLKAYQQVSILVLLCLASLFIHRSYENTNPLQMFIYFTPIYLIGCSVSQHRSSLLVNAKSKLLILGIIVLCLCIYEASVGHRGNYIKEMLVYGGVDTMFLQKLCLVIALFYFFEAFQFKSHLLSLLAKTSFGVFFIHPWVLTVLKRTPLYQYAETQDTDLLLFLLTLGFTLTVSVSIVLITKQVFGKKRYSQYITGY